MRIHLSVVLNILLFASCSSFARNHLILKSDFNGDGTADRVVYASNGISGYVQSTLANKKIDTFFIQQGSRSIFFTSHTSDGMPFIKLTEDAGFYSVITLMKYENREFRHVTSYALPGAVFFSDDFFSNTSVAVEKSKAECTSNSAFNNKATTAVLSWSEMLKQHALEDTIKKSIDSSCKNVFGSEEYAKLEKDLVAACRIESTPDAKKQNSLIACLDKNTSTRSTAASYQRVLASNIFEEGFKVTCDDIKKNAPKASFNKSTKTISLYQLLPPEKNRSYKADFFHEMLHSTGITSDNKIQPLVKDCLGFKHLASNLDKTDDRMYISNLAEQARERKDGIEVSIPNQVKDIPQTTIAATTSEGSKTLDNNFSMENSAQYDSLSKASKATFRSFDPIMKAAYEAAVPTAFAQGSLASSTTSSASGASVAMPTVKTAATTTRSIASTSSNSISSASGIYDISSLPASVSASEKGELGNGLAVKAAPVNIKEGLSRSPSSAETASGGTSSSSSLGGGSSGYAPTSDRPDLRNNVPQLKAEEDFVKILTTGKYAEVKARLTDPKNQKILEDKRIQYVARDKTLGSKQPVMILKDLGNKFSIVRVTIE